MTGSEPELNRKSPRDTTSPALKSWAEDVERYSLSAYRTSGVVMSFDAGKVELTFIYGKPGELGRTSEPQEYSVAMQRMHSCCSFTVTPLEVGVALLKAPGLSRARARLTDGTVIEGAVRCVQHNYFELVEDKRPA